MQFLGPLLPAAAQLLAGGGGGGVDHVLAGTIAGTSSFDASLVVDRTLAGTVTGSWAFTASLIVDRTLAGAVAGSGAFDGSLIVDRTLAGAVAGSCAFDGSLVVDRTLAGTLAGTGDFSAGLIVDRTLAGIIAGAADFSASLVVDRTLAGTINGAWAFAGDMRIDGAVFQRHFPESLAEWAVAFPYIPAPDHIWGFQESASPVLDLVGAAHLAKTGTVNFQQALEVEPTEDPRLNITFPTTGSGSHLGATTETFAGNMPDGTGWTLWLRASFPDTASTARGLASKRQDGNNFWVIYAYTGGAVRADIRSSGSTYRWSTVDTYDDDAWHDIVLVYDPDDTYDLGHPSWHLIVDETIISLDATGFQGISTSGLNREMRFGAPEGATVLAGTDISFSMLWEDDALSFAQAKLLFLEPWVPDYEQYVGTVEPSLYTGDVVGPTYEGGLTASDYVGLINASDYVGSIELQGDEMFSMVVGDRSPAFSAILTNSATGVPVDLTTASGVEVKFKIGENGAIKTGTATFTASSAGSVSYAWAANDLDDDGICYLRFVVTFPTAKTQTLPSTGGWYEFTVSA